MGISEEDRQKGTYLSLFDKIMAENFPKLRKEMNIEFQRAQNTPTRNREVGKITNLWKLHKLLNSH